MLRPAEIGQYAATMERQAERFVEAGLARARDILKTSGGDAVLVDAAGVAANFQRMVRIADATGIPIDNLDNPLGIEFRRVLELTPSPR